MIDFSTEELRAGAREARRVADQVQVARQASGAALPGNAFGILCSPLFLPAYTLVQAAADAMMDSATAAIERAADNLGATANAFDATDGATQTTFSSLGQGL